jgi:prophage maintenance system killer protein
MRSTIDSLPSMAARMEFAIEQRSIQRWPGRAIWQLMAKLTPPIWRLRTPTALARNHGFGDGNKRTAWVVARLFLADNGCRIRFNPGDAVKTMEAVASGTLGEAALAAWFRQRLEDVTAQH